MDTINNLGISTIYFSKNIIRNTISWNELLNNLKNLEVNCLELNADIPISWMKDISRSVNNALVKILSLHNFCPSVENIPKGKFGFNVYSLTSEDENERNLAVEYTLRTIRYASELNAEVVVLHLGEIKTEPSSEEFYKFVLNFGINSKLYFHYKNSLIKTRQINKQKYFDLLYLSLDKIIKFAEDNNVKLGIETRFYPNEIPNFFEVDEIINHYKSKILFYWHDFGHAEVQTRLGFTETHTKYLEKYKDKLIGYHIHNLIGYKDHFSPINGEMKFEELLTYKKDKIYILEVHSKENFENLKNGIRFIKSILKEGKIYERIS
ncbi:MAG: sugar phosphate isomerase/epimerase family protein [Endomicrobiia bacterium]